MFDWDKDQESLVAPSAMATDCNPDKGQMAGAPSWRRKLGLLGLGVVVGLGMIYEKDLVPQMRSQIMAGSTLFAPLPSEPILDTLPQNLVLYDEAQARAFLRGLRGADAATISAYLDRTEQDIRRAPPELAGYYQDVRTLLVSELARRLPSAS